MHATATFAAGCFWGVEELFRKVTGVIDVVSGYTGGTEKNPTYEYVCSGMTGHAEAVNITFDPSVVTYAELLKIFFENHNPTLLDQQGPDVGSQYRSAIFYHSDEQKREAEAFVKALRKLDTWKRPIVTQIVAATPFYKAEEYHQRYREKHGGSCHI